MTKDRMDLCVNLVGLFGVVLLSRPALYAAKLARLAARLNNLSPFDKTQQAKEMHEKAKKDLDEQRAGWSAGLNFCLLAGTVLTVVSYLIGVLKYFFAT